MGTDGKHYPFNPSEPEYLSKFSVDFCGYFKYGSVDQFRRE